METPSQGQCPQGHGGLEAGTTGHPPAPTHHPIIRTLPPSRPGVPRTLGSPSASVPLTPSACMAPDGGVSARPAVPAQLIGLKRVQLWRSSSPAPHQEASQQRDLQRGVPDASRRGAERGLRSKAGSPGLPQRGRPARLASAWGPMLDARGQERGSRCSGLGAREPGLCTSSACGLQAAPPPHKCWHLAWLELLIRTKCNTPFSNSHQEP